MAPFEICRGALIKLAQTNATEGSSHFGTPGRSFADVGGLGKFHSICTRRSYEKGSVRPRDGGVRTGKR